jgi:hypothetical protein
MLVTGLDQITEAFELEADIHRFAATPPLGAAGDAETEESNPRVEQLVPTPIHLGSDS